MEWLPLEIYIEYEILVKGDLLPKIILTQIVSQLIFRKIDAMIR